MENLNSKKKQDKTKHKMIKVGITGSTGLIGSILHEGLCDKYGLYLYDIKKTQLSCACEFFVVDLADRKQLNGIFDGLDVLIHLAGDPSPHALKESTFKNNFLVTSNVFEEARKAGVKKIIFASSNYYHQKAISQILGFRSKTISQLLHFFSKKFITLDMPPSPGSYYAESKVFGENLGRHLSNFGMQFITLRIGWVIKEDNPAVIFGKNRKYMRAVFCSKRDLVNAFEKAIESKAVAFLAAFVTSDNTHNVFDLNETKRILGFYPKDNAESYFK